MEIISDAPQQKTSVRPAARTQESNGMNLKSIVAVVLSKWYWFLLSLAITISAAAFYLMSTPPVYTRTAALLIKDDGKNGTASTSVDMSDLGFINSSTNLDNEIHTLKSPTLMRIVVERLRLNDIYTVREGFRDVNLYHRTPVTFISLDSVETPAIAFNFKTDEKGKVEIENIRISGEGNYTDLNASIGDTVKIGRHRFALAKPKWDASEYTGKSLNYAHLPVKGTSKALAAQVIAALGSDKSSIINLTISRPSIEEADDILRTLIQVYNERWIQDKNQIAVSTSRFIDERLGVIERELGNVDSDISSYKSAHLLPDVEAASSMYMSQSSEAQRAISDLNNQISVAEMLRRELMGDSYDQPLPTNTSIVNADIQSAIGQYNSIVIERNRLLETTSDKNPVVRDRTQALGTLRNNIISSINSYIATLRAQMGNAQRMASVATSRIAANPNQAKYLLSVERQQKVKESLYLFLLQKREENELTQAFTAYNTSMLEEPDGSTAPTSPQKGMIFLIAAIIGIMVPLVVIVIREMLDTKIRGKKDLASLTIPFLGEIPVAFKKARGFDRFDKKKREIQKKKIVVEDQNRDGINEAFRVLRTNLEFFETSGGPSGQESAKVIAVTSANPGSGKTFISVNLAKVLAIKGKRVLLIDCDLRKGSLSRILGNPNPGLTDYLIGRADLKDILRKSADSTSGLDAIGLGAVPPNPAELLASEKLDRLIAGFKEEYDFIVLDCPPVEIVADAKVINRVADMTIFVVRAGVLEKDELEGIQEYYDRGRYKNMAILLNGTDIYSGYGYHRYGRHYGYRYSAAADGSYYAD